MKVTYQMVKALSKEDKEKLDRYIRRKLTGMHRRMKRQMEAMQKSELGERDVISISETR